MADIPLDEVIYFDIITTSPTTAGAVDADSTPTFAVYEESTDTDIGIGGNMTKRTSLTGNYRGNFTASAANGFELGKFYSIVVTAVVGAVTGKATKESFRIIAAEATAGYNVGTIKSGTSTGEISVSSGIVDVNLKQILGTLLTETAGQLAGGFKKWFNVAAPTGTVNSIPDAVAGAASGIALVGSAMADSPGVTTLLTRLTSSRAGYLDNLNVGGAVASQTDINALNQSASRRVILTTVGQYERPESSTVTYTIEARTYDGDGAAVNADSTPTLTATGTTSGSLAANLGAVSNPATGVYRAAYTVSSSATMEEIHFDLSAVISSSTFTMAVYSQVTDLVSQTFTSTDRAHIDAIFNKLPSRNYLAGATATTGALVAADLPNLDVAVSTRSTYAGADTSGVTTLLSRIGAALTITGGKVDVNDKTGFSLSSAAVQSVWDALTSALTVVGSVGKSMVDLATSLAVVKSKTDNLPGAPAATGDIPTANQNADAYLDRVNAIETGITPRKLMKLQAATSGGKASGFESAHGVYRNINDSKDVVQVTTDESGNRTVVTLDLT